MIEKIFYMIFGKILDKVVDFAVHNRQNPEIARMSSYKLLVKEQADNALAILKRRGPLDKPNYVRFQLPGSLTESQQRTLMEFAEYYIATNCDQFDFEHIYLQWQSFDMKVHIVKHKYSKTLNHSPLWRLQHDYHKRTRL